MKVFFLGSGVFAAPCLRVLAASRSMELLGVVTQPDRPAGRNRAPRPTPVAVVAAELGLAVAKIGAINSPEALSMLAERRPDILLVASFGQILRHSLLQLPRIACVNAHSSLLPRHRGAAPVVASILAGEARTGVSFMEMDAGLDTGPVYCRFPLGLRGDERADSLELALGELAASQLDEVLPGIAGGLTLPEPQRGGEASYAAKISKGDGDIDWRLPAAAIERQTRAYHPWPGANFHVESRGRRLGLRLVEAVVVDRPPGASPGEIVAADKLAWVVACGEGALSIIRVVPEGKREMAGVEFLRGNPLEPGTVLG